MSDQKPEKVFHVFRSHAPTMGYVFRSGKLVHFLGGIYTTDVKSEIEELNEVIASGHPNYHVDENKLTVVAAELDPLFKIKEWAMEEARKELARATNPLNDMGNTNAGNTFASSVASSASVIGATVLSGSAQQSTGGAVTPGSIKAVATKL